MDFGSISGRSSKSSIKRKQSSSILTAFRKASAPPSSYNPPPSSTSTHFPEPESPYAESSSSQSHSNAFYPFSDFNPSSSSRYAESTTSTTMSSRTVMTAVPGSSKSETFHAQYGRGGAGRARTTSRTISVTSASGSDGKRAERENGREWERDKEREREKSGGPIVRRPEDMVKVVRDRLFSWSYMMQWYQGDTHWFNTVKIPRTATEAYLGPKHLESRARNYFILGISLGLLFDIANAGDYLRAVNRVLEEWENMVEGGGKVRGLFKGQKGNRKSGGTSGEYMSMQDGDSALLQVNLPFTLDFFQIHSTTCSLIRDVYKKALRLFLPSRPPTSAWMPPIPDHNALLHPSTIIHAAPLEAAPLPSRSNSSDQTANQDVRSPSTRSVSSNSHSLHQSYTAGLSPRTAQYDADDLGPGVGIGQAFAQTPTPVSGTGPTSDENGGGRQALGESEHDAFQAYITGELGPDRMLVGEGQAMTKEVVDLFTKVDAKLRKQLSLLLRETDLLARRVLDEELTTLMSSLDPASKPLAFDYTAALSHTGNGFGINSGIGARGGGEDSRSISGRSAKSGTSRSISSSFRGPRVSAPTPAAARRDDTEYLYSETRSRGSISAGTGSGPGQLPLPLPSPSPSPSPASASLDPIAIPPKARAALGVAADDMDTRQLQQPRGVPMGLPEGFDEPPSRHSRGAGTGVPQSVSEEGHELGR